MLIRLLKQVNQRHKMGRKVLIESPNSSFGLYISLWKSLGSKGKMECKPYQALGNCKYY